MMPSESLPTSIKPIGVPKLISLTISYARELWLSFSIQLKSKGVSNMLS